MLTIIDCARLSKDVYRPISIFKTVNPNQSKSASLHGLYRVHQGVSEAKDDFFGALYVKFVYGEPTEAVIAIRGTVVKDVSNDFEDIIGWTSNVLGDGSGDKAPQPFTDLTVEFVKQSLKTLRAHFKLIKTVTITGHSLGGALAKLAVLKGLSLDFAVAFNAPGVGQMVSDESKSEYAQKIHNINACYGVINKIGEDVGQLKVIDVPEMATAAKAVFTNFDEKDFAESLKKLAKNPKASWLSLGSLLGDIRIKVEGAADRLKAYLSAERGLVNSPTIRNRYLRCASEADAEHWYQLEAILKLKLTQNVHALDELDKVITEQHSINNMVKALKSPKYRFLVQELS